MDVVNFLTVIIMCMCNLNGQLWIFTSLQSIHVGDERFAQNTDMQFIPLRVIIDYYLSIDYWSRHRFIIEFIDFCCCCCCFLVFFAFVDVLLFMVLTVNWRSSPGSIRIVSCETLSSRWLATACAPLRLPIGTLYLPKLKSTRSITTTNPIGMTRTTSSATWLASASSVSKILSDRRYSFFSSSSVLFRPPFVYLFSVICGSNPASEVAVFLFQISFR